jgi:hypothetical protein
VNGKIALLTVSILSGALPGVAQSGASITTKGPNIAMQQNLDVAGAGAAGGISASNQGCTISCMGAMAGINELFLAQVPQGSNAIGLFLMGTAWDSPMTNGNFTSSSNIQLPCVYSE